MDDRLSLDVVFLAEDWTFDDFEVLEDPHLEITEMSLPDEAAGRQDNPRASLIV